MLTADQLRERRHGISSTDVAKIVGVSPYGTKHNVYLDKRGLVDVHPDTLATRIGSKVESLIVDLYEEETGAKTEACGTLRHPTEAWILGTPDRIALLDSARTLLEIKWVGWRLAHHFAPRADDATQCATCGNREGSHWGRDTDAVPDYVRCQCEWLMMVTETTQCHVAALLGGDEFRIYRIDSNPNLAARLRDVCRAFWFDSVLAEKPPEFDGSEGSGLLAASLYPKERAPLKQAPDGAAKWVRRWQRADKASAHADRVETEAKANLRALIGDAEGIVGDFGKITCKSQRNARHRVLRFYPKRKENGN